MLKTRSDEFARRLRLTELRSRLGSNAANSTKTAWGSFMASWIWTLNNSHLLISPYGSRISLAMAVVIPSPLRL